MAPNADPATAGTTGPVREEQLGADWACSFIRPPTPAAVLVPLLPIDLCEKRSIRAACSLRPSPRTTCCYRGFPKWCGGFEQILRLARCITSRMRCQIALTAWRNNSGAAVVCGGRGDGFVLGDPDIFRAKDYMTASLFINSPQGELIRTYQNLGPFILVNSFIQPIQLHPSRNSSEPPVRPVRPPRSSHRSQRARIPGDILRTPACWDRSASAVPRAVPPGARAVTCVVVSEKAPHRSERLKGPVKKVQSKVEVGGSEKPAGLWCFLLLSFLDFHGHWNSGAIFPSTSPGCQKYID